MYGRNYAEYTCSTYVRITLFGYKKIGSLRVAFTGTSTNIINFVNSKIINKGNTEVSDVPTFNSSLGVRLAFYFRLTIPDHNHKDASGLCPMWIFYCSNNSTSSIYLSSNDKNNVTTVPNLLGDGIVFLS